MNSAYALPIFFCTVSKSISTHAPERGSLPSEPVAALLLLALSVLPFFNFESRIYLNQKG